MSEEKNFKQTICLDFDGVIHSYLSGWKGPTIIPDPPTEGAKEAIEMLREEFKVVVSSARCGQGGIPAMEEWMVKHGIMVDEICEHKPPAKVYVDDRAVLFTNDWAKTITDVREFEQWSKK